MLSATSFFTGGNRLRVEYGSATYELQALTDDGNQVCVQVKRDGDWVLLGHARKNGASWLITDPDGQHVGAVPWRSPCLDGYELDGASRLLGGPSRVGLLTAA